MNRIIDKNRKHARRKLHIRKSISGTALRPRMTVFRSNLHMYAQVIDDTTGRTLAASSSVVLKLENGGNIEAAKKVGADIAEKCKALNIESVRFDRGGYVYHGRVQALANAAREAGLKF